MMEITILTCREVSGREFRIYGTPDDPLFLARDVAEWIGHTNPTEMVRHIDDCEKLNSIIFSAGQKREMLFITEDGLYEIFMQSRKPIAKQFKAQIKEILKSIRKHGAYITPQTMEEMIANPDFTIKLLTELKSEREQKTALAAQIERDKPKVQFADALATSKDLILVRGLAKLLRQNGVLTGEKRLFQDLRDKGYLLQFGTERNMPTQYSMEHGLFEIRERPLTYNGETRLARTPMVTTKGQRYFLRKLLREEEAI